MSRSRALSPISSVIVVVIVLALVGVIAYGVMGGFTPNGGTSCSPPTAAACGALINTHDVSLIVPYQSVQEGSSVPVTASLPVGETASSFTFNFGDGSLSHPLTQPVTNHTYSEPGIYLLSVKAPVNGLVHDNDRSLIQIKVTSSFAAASNDSLPTIGGAIAANSTAVASVPSPTAVLQAGESVTLTTTYTNAPTNPLWREVPLVFKNPTGATVRANSSTDVSSNETVAFGSAGQYVVTAVGGATDLANTSSVPLAYQNFTWSIFVAATGTHAGVAGLSSPRSPHPGTIISYEDAPGGARTEDPALAYDTVSYEPIANVYEPLINYNGTDIGPNPSDFIPVLATCVPGSAQCEHLYNGQSLVNGTNYTFVINGASRFYDSRTGASWGVYPSDVVFSIARTLGYSTLPSVGSNNGWILAQSLLNSGNVLWDSIHASYNNTPQNIFASMTVNESGACPAQAISQDHGCVTFHADGNHRPWPYFLELIADPLGGSIVPCGWFSASAQAAGIPYWTSGNSTGSGDHPCGLPGSPGWGAAPSQVPATGWDQWETIGSGSTGKAQGNVNFNMVGSGPYYLSQYSVALSYSLTASPAYVQNPYCTWAACWPAPGHFAKNVEVTWESSPTPGEQALAAGVADFASVPSSDLSLLLQLIQEGKVNAVSAPTLTVSFAAFDLSFSVQRAQQYTTNSISIPSDFFSYLGMRQLFSRAYPYTTIQNTINTKNGIQLAFNYGGAIPQFMGDYYPGNISWPSLDPSLACAGSLANTASCPTWWWGQMHQTTSPYYDQEVASCTASSPCNLPLFGVTGSPVQDIINNLWAQQISTITGGAIQVSPVDVSFVNLLINDASTPGQNPMPFYGLGWAPDYPDPTDYVQPLYLENSTYTYSDAVAQGLFTPQFSTGCTHPATDYGYYASLSQPVSQSCQGVAYKSMVRLFEIAGETPAGPTRVLYYDMAEHIANQLALYTYQSQGNLFASASSWININSLNTNPTLGAGGALPYFWVTGNGLTG